MGREAAKTLNQLLEGKKTKSAVFLKSSGLVKRESSQMITTSDEVIVLRVNTHALNRTRDPCIAPILGVAARASAVEDVADLIVPGDLR